MKKRILMNKREKEEIRLMLKCFVNGFWCFNKAIRMYNLSCKNYAKAIKALERGSKKLDKLKGDSDPRLQDLEIHSKVVVYETLARTYGDLAKDMDSRGEKFILIAKSISDKYKKIKK